MHDDAPAGYHYEWLPCGDEWRLDGEGYKCRMNRCGNSAVAALRRRIRRKGPNADLDRYRWWHYCADHLYGRKIEDGVIKERRLVKDDELEKGT